jgi:hypothetical protein
MSFKTLSVSTGRGIATLSKVVAVNTKAAFNPEPGNRKTRITLLMVIPALIGIGILVFVYKEAVVDLVKIAADLIFKTLAIFGVANTGEHMANSFGGKDKSAGGGESPSDKPFEP